MRPTARLLACVLFVGAALSAAVPAHAARAKARTPHKARAAPRESDESIQARKIEAGKSAAERLRNDSRRRRLREGWEAVLRDFDGAVRVAPKGPRAAEAALEAARIREELWGVSRTKADARAAVAAYTQVDAQYSGTAEAKTALLAAVQLALRTHDTAGARTAARKLTSYPRTPEVKAALARAGVSDAPRAPEAPKPPATLAQKIAGARAATPADRTAQLPVDDEEDDESEPAPAKASPRAGIGAPPSPEREPSSDVPAEAARVLDALVAAARNAGNADLLEGKPTAARAAKGEAAKGDAAKGEAAKGEAPQAETEADDGTPPEPEAPEALEVEPRKTRASAPREDEPDPDAARKAREIRTAILHDGGAVSAELGLKVRKVVVDAGHGGRDTGAISKKGVREKDVTLAIAKKLAARLRKLGLQVVLTRSGDEYVSLDERTRVANEAKADLFVSIHCNSAHGKNLSGVETWTLNVSSDRYARRLAAFENAEAGAGISDLRLILADLATRANSSEAHQLASSVQASLVQGVRSRVGKVKDNGVKQALFYVLLGARMPSILVETAFLSNPEEEKRLKSAKYQDATAESIARGVKDFLDSRQRLALR